MSHPDTLPITFPVSLQLSPELGQGDEPRGSTREESGGDVHSAEGPRAAHAEEDGVKCECLWATGCLLPSRWAGPVQPALGEGCGPVIISCQVGLPKHRARMVTVGSIAEIIFPLQF